MVFQWRRIGGPVRADPAATRTASSPRPPPTQRMNVSAKGVTWPTIARPITQLSDQKSDVSVSSR